MKLEDVVELREGFLLTTEMMALEKNVRETLDLAGAQARTGSGDALDESPMKTRSRILRYGYTYENKPKKIHRPWPSWLISLRRLVRRTFADGEYDAVTLNEYPPGSEIEEHLDSLAFEDEIVSLGLGAVGLFSVSFSSSEEDESRCVMPMRPGDLLRLKRRVLHGCKNMSDAVRYSIVFRRLRKAQERA